MGGGQRIPSTLSQIVTRSQPSTFVCRSCRNQLKPPQRSNAHQIRRASNTPVIDYVRRKLWRTDNPPGPADPYGPSWADRRKMALEQQREEQRRANLSPQERAVEDDVQVDERDLREARPNYFPNHEDETLEKTLEENGRVEEDLASDVPGAYKAAQTWDGLEHVGHRGNWKDIPPKPEDAYQSWLAPKPELPWTRQELVLLLHQAIAENLLSTGNSLVSPRYYARKSPSDFSIVLAEDGALRGVEERVASSEVAVLELDEMEDDLEPEVMADGISATETKQSSEHISNAEAEQIIEEIVASSPNFQKPQDTKLSPSLVPESPLDETFLSARLDFADPLTFKILKRFQQLASTRLPDSFLNTLFASTSKPKSKLTRPFHNIIAHILDAQKPKAKNLYEKLIEKGHLTGQSNLMILPRRETPVDKEKEVGRWKVIERELRERGLPVLGKVGEQ